MNGPADGTGGPIEEHGFVPAPAELVYLAVADLRRMGRWSPECVRVLTRRPGAAEEGDRFLGLNRAGRRWWATGGRVCIADPGREFAFDIDVFGLPAARWGYRFHPSGGGTEVTEYWQDRRGSGLRRQLLLALGRGFTWVRGEQRVEHNREGMRATLARIAAGFPAG
jgi:hypothetical protein